jgi:hypothetical protein
MDLTKIASSLSGGVPDPGTYIKQELEQGLGPVLERVDKLEKKLDLLILAIGRVEALLKTIKPVVDLLKKLPFLK